jgi:hypothetical protein
MLPRNIGQQPEVEGIVSFTKEARATVVPALPHVEGYAGDDQSGCAGHYPETSRVPTG